jgi:CubicO group peptidase (beta-lactamase class C family)
MPGFRSCIALVVMLAVAACTSPQNPPMAPEPARTPATPAQAETVARIVRETMTSEHLRSAIVRVTVDGKELVNMASGESTAGVPATTDMHFRNGAVAISYIATLLLKLVDERRVTLDDRLSKYLPDTTHADRVTLRQLAQMTSGYPDYVIGNDAFTSAFYADPFRTWTPEELLRSALTRPLLYEPGTNWNYAHTNYVLLGSALERATGEQLANLLEDKVLRPLALTNTANSFTPEIPAPALHAFSSERRAALGIAAATPFYEESTFWNPAWTLAPGAVQTATIADLAATAAGVGSGRLLSPESYREMTSTALRGKTRPQADCVTCAALDNHYTYGLGLVISGDWLLQNPMFGGYAAIAAYLPVDRMAIATAVTFAPEAFDKDGNYTNSADVLFRRIGAALAPDHTPPIAARR